MVAGFGFANFVEALVAYIPISVRSQKSPALARGAVWLCVAEA